MELETRMKRWRLILGEESSPQFGKMGGVELTDEQLLMDQALASICPPTRPWRPSIIRRTPADSETEPAKRYREAEAQETALLPLSFPNGWGMSEPCLTRSW